MQGFRYKRFKLRQPRKKVARSARYPLWVGVGVAVTLVAALVSVSIWRSRTALQLYASREHIAAGVQSELRKLIDAYDRTGIAGADIENELLPAMQSHLYAANAIHEVLVDAFGEDEGVMPRELFADLDNALRDLEDAIGMGRKAGSYLEQVGISIAQVQTALDERFGASSALMPGTVFQ